MWESTAGSVAGQTVTHCHIHLIRVVLSITLTRGEVCEASFQRRLTTLDRNNQMARRQLSLPRLGSVLSAGLKQLPGFKIPPTNGGARLTVDL
jgi:hypothetical protein